MSDFEDGQFVFSIDVDSAQDADSAQRYIVLRLVVPEAEGESNTTERLEERRYLLTPEQARYLYEGLLLSPLYNPDT